MVLLTIEIVRGPQKWSSHDRNRQGSSESGPPNDRNQEGSAGDGPPNDRNRQESSGDGPPNVRDRCWPAADGVPNKDNNGQLRVKARLSETGLPQST